MPTTPPSGPARFHRVHFWQPEKHRKDAALEPAFLLVNPLSNSNAQEIRRQKSTQPL
ncbi:MAG: hypothetical protein WCA10_17875 [Terracidiphilus sp.]